MLNKQQERIRKVLERHRNKEHLIEYWLCLINARFAAQFSVSGARSLIKQFKIINSYGFIIEEKDLIVSGKKTKIKEKMYKYMLG